MYYYPYPHYNREQAKPGSIRKLASDLLNAIKGEATAIQFYNQLMQMARTNEERSYIAHALEDEQTHLRQFINLYTSLFGAQPVYQAEQKTFSSFAEGLKIAREDEFEAYESYRNVYLSTKDMKVRDVFFRAMTDEIEHALRFSILALEQPRS
ncbi:ferritin family protein [Anoxybacteroides tepidamans]|uniref:ferritin family protein n=1 Tax=Anoxybacteroides tepidamans TaxID=265948 RepID=UPI000558F912|nr:ferritin-like domain-containing protein [Anoxybacillus tepidamans]